MADKSVVMGVELGISFCGMTVVSKKTGNVLATNFVSSGIDYLSNPKETATLLHSWIDELGKKITKIEIVLGIESSRSVIKICKVPGDVVDFEDHLEWELGIQINSPVPEYSWDYQKLGSADANGEQQVLLAASRKRFLRPLVKELKSQGLQIASIDFDIVALVNALELAEDSSLLEKAVVLRVEKNYLMLAEIKDGKLHSYWESALSTEDESGGERVGLAVQLLASHTDSNVFICGSLGADEGFKSSLEASSGKSLLPLNPFKSLSFAEGVDAPDDEKISQCAVATALAVNSQRGSK